MAKRSQARKHKPLNANQKKALDAYIAGPTKGSGTKSWQAAYPAARSPNAANNNWRELIQRPEAQEYIMARVEDVEARRAAIIAYDRAEYMGDLKRMLESAMRPRKIIGAEGEWEEVPGTMDNLAEAHKIAKALYAEEKGATFPALKVDITHHLQRPDEIVDVSPILEKFREVVGEDVVDAEILEDPPVLLPPSPHQ